MEHIVVPTLAPIRAPIRDILATQIDRPLEFELIASVLLPYGSAIMIKTWWKEAVVYQIYPRSFFDANNDGIGDLSGVIAKLDYLKWLGVNAVWMSPIYASPMDDNGYDISDYYAINPEFGSMDDFDAMLAEMHKRGIRLIMDLVVNHTSDEHPWFLDARSSRTSAKRDYYIWHTGRDGKEPNNWASFFKGSAWEFDQHTEEYYLHLFSKKQPDLNWKNPELREEIYTMMDWWFKKGIDGFRMDVINFLAKAPGFPDAAPSHPSQHGRRFIHGQHLYANQPGMHDILKEMRQRVLCKYDITTVGECIYIDPHQGLEYVGSDRGELDMVFQFDTVRAQSIPSLKKAVREWHEAMSDQGWNTVTLSNHDTPRQVSVFGDDQNYHVDSAKLLATFLITAPGTVYFLQGEEIGMTNVSFPRIEDYRDIEIVNAYRELLEEGIAPEDALCRLRPNSRDNARTPLQWSAEPNAGFSDATPWIGVNPNYPQINVAAQQEDPNSILAYYRELIALRHREPMFVYGSYKELETEHDEIYIYARSMGEKRVIVALNFSSTATVCRLPTLETVSHTLLGNYPAPSKPEGSSLELRAWEAVIMV